MAMGMMTEYYHFFFTTLVSFQKQHLQLFDFECNGNTDANIPYAYYSESMFYICATHKQDAQKTVWLLYKNVSAIKKR